jgi:hypothetical protein
MLLSAGASRAQEHPASFPSGGKRPQASIVHSCLRQYTYRLYPNKQQQRLLEQQLEECRWLYNHLVAERRYAWDQRQESLR